MPANRPRLLILGAIGVLVVVVAGLGVVFFATRQHAGVGAIADGNSPIPIEVSDKTCTPNELAVPAGVREFQIKNTSDRAIEWEILSGVMVVAERENIAPGFVVTVTPRLDAGSYEMTCGLLSNPHGTLTVVAQGGAVTPAGPPQVADLVAPTAAYRVFAIQTADDLTEATAATASAAEAGQLDAARTDLAAANASFAKLAPILHLFSRDADAMMNGSTSLPDLTKLLAAATPAHSPGRMAAATARAAATLGGTIHATTPAPREIVAGAGQVVAEMSTNLGDPTIAAARIAGVRKIVDLFEPLTLRADSDLAQQLDTDLTTIEGELTMTPPDLNALNPKLKQLSADLTKLQSALGLDVT